MNISSGLSKNKNSSSLRQLHTCEFRVSGRKSQVQSESFRGFLLEVKHSDYLRRNKEETVRTGLHCQTESKDQLKRVWYLFIGSHSQPRRPFFLLTCSYVSAQLLKKSVVCCGSKPSQDWNMTLISSTVLLEPDMMRSWAQTWRECSGLTDT